MSGRVAMVVCSSRNRSAAGQGVFLVVRARLEARGGEGVGLITMRRHPSWHGRTWYYRV